MVLYTLDNALAALQVNNVIDLNNRKAWRVDNADDLLLPIPLLTGTKRRGHQEGVSKSILQLLQNSLLEEDLPVAVNERVADHISSTTSQSYANTVRIISRSPITVMASRVSFE